MVKEVRRYKKEVHGKMNFYQNHSPKDFPFDYHPKTLFKLLLIDIIRLILCFYHKRFSYFTGFAGLSTLGFYYIFFLLNW